MSDIIQTINYNECVGNSLQKINSNFAALEQEFTKNATITEGSGISVNDNVSSSAASVSVSTKNSFVYQDTFVTTNGATLTSLALSDQTQCQFVAIPYSSLSADNKPYISFTTIAPNNNAPKLTLYWTASGANDLTIYATNSSVSTTSKGSLYFNDTVNTLQLSGSRLYVGGNFTAVGSSTQNKFAVLNLGTDQSVNGGLGAVGSLSLNVLSGLNTADLGQEGEVFAISPGFTAVVDGTVVDAIAVGGSFDSVEKGKGLTVVNLSEGNTDDNTIPFYVNGEVRCLGLSDSYLYVGGVFNEISYGAVEAVAPVATKGFARIKLNQLDSPLCIDETFITNVGTLFNTNCEVNAIVTDVLADRVYIGGSFSVYDGATLVARNLVEIESSGIQTDWKPILNGPVLTLNSNFLLNQPHLYVGGRFTSFQNGIDGTKHSVYNACCFPQTGGEFDQIKTEWTPKFDGPVTSFAVQNENDPTNGVVYCSGQFTKINEQSCEYLGAVNKATVTTDPGKLVTTWRARVNNGPGLYGNTVALSGSSLLVGGNFDSVNEQVRYKLARIDASAPSTVTAKSSAVNWEVGAQLIGFGTPLALDFNAVTSVSASTYTEAYKTINKTAFAPLESINTSFKEGQMLRFYVKRNGKTATTDDGLRLSAFVLGCAVDFNS